MPEEAWEALEVSLLRAVEDDSYRDDVLRAKGIVSARSLYLSSTQLLAQSGRFHICTQRSGEECQQSIASSLSVVEAVQGSPPIRAGARRSSWHVSSVSLLPLFDRQHNRNFSATCSFRMWCWTGCR